jgi:hypothetical protein
MTDYLGPLTLGTSGTYTLLQWTSTATDESVEVALKIHISSTSEDGLSDAIEELVAQVRIGNTYVRYWPGVTYPVAYLISGVAGFTVDNEFNGSNWPAFWQRVSFTLTMSAMPQGAYTTLYSGQHVDTPSSVSLEALLGTRATPLDITIDDDNSTDMRSVLCALSPTALSDSKWLVMASALSWTTMSSGTGAAYWGNSNRYTISSSYQTAPLDTSQYPAGKYRLWVRVCQEAGTGYIKDSQNDTAIAITRTTPHLLCIGDLDLPVYDTALGTAANLTISVKSDGTNDCLVNALVILPLDYGYFSWHDTDSDTSEIDQLDVGPSGIFMDGACDATYFQGGVLSPRIFAVHTQSFVDPATPASSTWPTSWGRTDSTTVNCGMPTAVSATSDTGYETYLAGSGRLFLGGGTNLCVDPQGTAQTFWPTDTAHTDITPNFDVPVAVTGHAELTKCLKLVNDGTADAPVTANVTVSASISYHSSIYVYAPTLGGNLTITVENGHTFSLAALTGTNAGFVRYNVQSNTVAGEVVLGLKFSFAGGGASTVYVTGFCPIAATVLTPYFDGSTNDSLNPSTYAWTGTAHASTSVRAGSVLRYSSMIGNVGTIAARVIPLGAGNDSMLQVLLGAGTAAGNRLLLLKSNVNVWRLVRDAATLSSAGLSFAGGTAHSLVARWSASTLDLTHDGTIVAQGADASVYDGTGSISVGVYPYDLTTGPGTYIAAAAFSPSRITDAETAALDTLLTGAGVTGYDVYKFFADRGYHGTLVLPLESNATGYVTP